MLAFISHVRSEKGSGWVWPLVSKYQSRTKALLYFPSVPKLENPLVLNNFVLPHCENSRCSIALHKFSFYPCSAVLLWLYVSCSSGKHVHTTHLRAFKRLLTVPRNYTCAFLLTHAVVFVSQAILSLFLPPLPLKACESVNTLKSWLPLQQTSCAEGQRQLIWTEGKKYGCIAVGDGRRQLPLLKPLDFSGAPRCQLKSLAAAVLAFPEMGTCDILAVVSISRNDEERQSTQYPEELCQQRRTQMQGCHEALASNKLFHRRRIFQYSR